MLMAERSLEEFDCYECSEQQQRARNCDGTRCEDNKPFRLQLMDHVPILALDRCPRQYIDDEIIQLWDGFQLFKLTGHLPFAGGYLNQPHVFIEVIKYCEMLTRRILDDPSYLKAVRTKKNKLYGVSSNIETTTLDQIKRRKHGNNKSKR